MRVEANEHGIVESSHLPPVEHSELLGFNARGRVIALDKIPAPVNEYGIPSVSEYLVSLTGTLSAEYEVPGRNNVHHLVYPRSEYRKKGIGSVPHKFRESASLMIKISEQIHNYGHWIMEPYKRPHIDVMTQYVHEDDQMNTLFKIGRAVITAPRWLNEMSGNGVQQFRTAEDYVRRNEPTEAHFFDYLDTCQDAQIGHMTNRQKLADMGVEAATQYLGTLVAVRSMQRQRLSREMVKAKR